MTDELDAVMRRLETLEASVERLRSMTARTYERSEGWPERLAAIRATPAYAEAFSGTPLITVRIGTYRGAEALISRALASVRRQTYANWEAVVVGDGCDDDTEERISELADPRIRFYNRPLNGPYPDQRELRWLVAGTFAFNEAAERASGSWIAPIDQDDEWDDDHLTVLLHAAQCSKAELVYGQMRAVIDGTDQETWFGEWPPCQGDFGFQAALYHGGLKGFGYDVAAALLGEPGDWNLARRMWEAGVRFHFLPRSVGTYYVGEDSPALGWWQDRVRQRGALAPMSPPKLPSVLKSDIGHLLSLVPVDFGGGCSECEAGVLAELIVHNEVLTAVDIGVYGGRCLLPMAAAFRWLGRGQAVGIDPYTAEAANRSFGTTLAEWARALDWDQLYQGVVDLLDREGLASSARLVRARAGEAVHQFAAGSIDLLHIDGNHDADTVRNDYLAYRPCIRPGGFVVLDNVIWASVQPIYEELRLRSTLVVEAYTSTDNFAVFAV